MERIIPLTEGANLAAGRHPKWQRVEPGTVIPAGQPYRVEWVSDKPKCDATELPGSTEDWTIRPSSPHRCFVDSSWRPPLVLPTEPTWGIAVHRAGSFTDKWFTVPERPGRLINGRGAKLYVASVADFIPLTDEQVQRIEAAR